jgi:hypothetical protein
MIHTLNITYNISDAVDYFEILKSDFQKLHWKYREHHCDPRGIEDKNVMDNIHGWGLQTIYADPMFPYHCDIDPHDEGPEYFKDTALVFGFFKELKNKFLKPYRSFLMTFPPKHYIGKWLPGGPPHGKVFIPIVTNNKTAIIDLTNNQIVPFKLGKIYMFDMTTDYGEFKNDGDTEITFITFNIPADTFHHILSTV